MQQAWIQRLIGVLAVLVLALAPSPALAQGDEASETELLQDFVHYVRIDQYELAADMGQQLLDRALEPRAFVALVEDALRGDEFVQAVIIARRPAINAELRRVADELDRLYEEGRRARARDPKEISRNIELLTGTLRQIILGRERLVAAGEYAMPQLLEALFQTDSLALRNAARQVMLEMGQQAVMPLVAALAHLDAPRQELVVNVLAQIEYDTWLPYVRELQEATDSEDVRRACARAIRMRLGDRTIEGDVASWFYDLAERFYGETREVTAFPGEAYQLVWDFNPAIPGSGLSATPVRTEVYHEAMAMRMSERSIRHRATRNPAWGLWVAANFSREIDTPQGYENPLYTPDRREAMFFATSLGVDTSQWVLARALDTNDTPLALRAIAAIQRIAGAGDMQEPILFVDHRGSSDRRPLIEALTYPNRRVQYESALALARTQPERFFDGAERVVPLLSSAIRDASKRFGVVIAPDGERQSVLRRLLEGEGYQVIAGASLDEVRAPLADLPGVDVVLMDVESDRVRGMLGLVRGDPRLSATPVLVLTQGAGFAQVRRRLDGDATVAVRRTGISEGEVRATLASLVEEASGGPISADEARQYASRSIEALRDLAISRNAVFDVADAALPLIATLTESEGQVKFRVAEVLSWINQQRVQVAMMEEALDAGGIERIELMEQVANSAKRFGNLLEARQVDRLIDFALSAEGIEATAAASLMGALDLPNDRVVPLIISQANQTTTASR